MSDIATYLSLLPDEILLDLLVDVLWFDILD